MTEREKYIQFITKETPPRDILEAIAEESAELSKAALKMIRADGLSKNPTPTTAEKAIKDVRDEFLDLLMVMDVWGIDLKTAVEMELNCWKWQRWAERLRGNANG